MPINLHDNKSALSRITLKWRHKYLADNKQLYHTGIYVHKYSALQAVVFNLTFRLRIKEKRGKKVGSSSSCILGRRVTHCKALL
jgi:hypothetical protein